MVFYWFLSGDPKINVLILIIPGSNITFAGTIPEMYFKNKIANHLAKNSINTSVSERKYIIASAFKFKLLHYPQADGCWAETSGAWWIFFSRLEPGQ